MNKKRNIDKLAVIFAEIALVSGIIFIFWEFFPFEYKGETGIDYIGQAIVWSVFVRVFLYVNLAIYLGFAMTASVFAILVMKQKEKRRKGVMCLILSWICGLVIAVIVITNMIADRVHKNSIEVEVTGVTLTADTYGEPAIRVELELYNGSRTTVSYFTSVYDEVTQNGMELSHAVLQEDLYDDADEELLPLKPGETVTIVKGYEPEDPDGPVNILCRSYDGTVVYVDDEFETEE